jgi:hypothetical protein
MEVHPFTHLMEKGIMQMVDTIDADQIQGSWTHSHEDDEGDKLVFRASDFAFPLSRGRTSFTLKPGGAVEYGNPGPDDRRTKAAGSWSLQGNILKIQTSQLSRIFAVESLDDQILVVRRI